jgi:DNA polymerase-3 subunit delta'
MGFDELIIPQQVKQVLRSAVIQRRLPAAYLFVGPQGVGKQTTAVVLAKALNCLSAGGDACDRCTVCARIERRVHPDVHLIEPQGQAMKIDQIRHLQEVLTLQAYEGRVKVAILDEAGSLTVEAANSLLKILEEPPSQTLFVLASRQLGNLPATLISRTQILRFGLMAPDDIAAWLRHHIAEAGEAERRAHLSGGRPGVALSLDLAAILERRSAAARLLAEILANDPEAMLRNAEHWGKRKADHALLFEMLLSILRDLAIMRAGGSATYLLHRDSQNTLLPQATALPTPTLWDIFDIVHSAQEAIAHNVNPQLAFEVMFLKIGDAYERARQRERARPRTLVV